MSMSPEEKAKLQYRFSGYQIPKMQLDSTGPSYYVTGVHPYYKNQPAYWAHEAFPGHPGGFGDASDANKLFPFQDFPSVDENT